MRWPQQCPGWCRRQCSSSRRIPTCKSVEVDHRSVRSSNKACTLVNWDTVPFTQKNYDDKFYILFAYIKVTFVVFISWRTPQLPNTRSFAACGSLTQLRWEFIKERFQEKKEENTLSTKKKSKIQEKNNVYAYRKVMFANKVSTCMWYHTQRLRRWE